RPKPLARPDDAMLAASRRARRSLGGTGSPPRIHQLREAVPAWPPLHQKAQRTVFGVPATLHSPRSSCRERPPSIFLSYAILKVTLDLEFTLADTRGFVPMQVRKHDLAIRQSNARNALSLAPSTAPVALPQSVKFPDTRARRDGFDDGEFTDDLKEHAEIVTNRRGGVN